MNLKSPREIAIMKESGHIVFQALELARGLAKPGISTLEINNKIEEFIIAQNAIPSFKGYNDFPAAICASINDEVVHGIPSKRILVEGDILSVDVGAKYNGYHADAARTFPVGNVNPEYLRLIEVTEKCFWNGVEKIKPGNRISDISIAIEKTAKDAGFYVIKELIGHGVGQNLHEKPDVYNYYTGRRGERLVPGLVIAIEPMINLSTEDIEMLQDGSTIVTCDGGPSAHYENTVAVTENGYEVLTNQ